MWVWNYRKTRKIQIDKLAEIRIKYNDNNEKRHDQYLRNFSVVGYYEKTITNIGTVQHDIILVTDNDELICQAFVDKITGEDNAKVK